MPNLPQGRKIYHITHVTNLPAIAREGLLWSDAERIKQGLTCQLVGMSTIKERRLKELSVRCHPGTKVGDYVPFYFCPRSIMLFIIHKGNHRELSYRGGQEPMVHLQCDLLTTIAWAEAQRVPWAFSDRNAGTYLAQFFKSAADLDKVNWSAVAATSFTDTTVKEGKQAEFLVHRHCPWHLVEKIGVINAMIQHQTSAAIHHSSHRPPVCIEPSWYYSSW